jgi:acetyltransferase-like isoleucine patch superfamily enzyme
MISESVVIEGIVDLADNCLLYPSVRVIGPNAISEESEGNENQTKVCKIGEYTVVEEKCTITSSQIGNNTLISSGTVVNYSKIGDHSKVSAKCTLLDSTIGNNCIISAGVHMVGAEIPDNTAVYALNGSWCSREYNPQIFVSIISISFD